MTALNDTERAAQDWASTRPDRPASRCNALGGDRLERV